MRLFIAFFPSIPLSILLEVLPVRLDFLDFTVSRSWQMILSLVGTGVVCTFWNVPVITLRASLNSDPSLCVAIPGLGVGMSQGLSGLQQAIVTLYNDAQTIILRLGLARTLQTIRWIYRMYPTHGKLRFAGESRERVNFSYQSHEDLVKLWSSTNARLTSCFKATLLLRAFYKNTMALAHFHYTCLCGWCHVAVDSSATFRSWETSQTFVIKISKFVHECILKNPYFKHFNSFKLETPLHKLKGICWLRNPIPAVYSNVMVKENNDLCLENKE